MLATGRPVRWNGEGAQPVPAPVLGQDTEEVLADVLGMSTAQIRRLGDSGVVGLHPMGAVG